jgi:hypothetical protein
MGELYFCHRNSNTKKMKGKTKIKIQGHLDKKWEDWFDGMRIIYDGDNTILSGIIKDEAFMHGILNKIRDLNLNLISINPSEEKFDNNLFNNHKTK